LNAHNLTKHDGQITPFDRSTRNGHDTCVVWFTGLSGSGKSTLAFALEEKLFSKGIQVITLDGDGIRLGLNKNLGFDQNDRSENLRRIAEVAKLMNQAGLVVLAAFISPFDADRMMIKHIVGSDKFVEVFVSTPLEICAERDPKGLYKKAVEGTIPEFTGVSSPYETPLKPDINVDTTNTSTDEIVKTLEGIVLKKINWND
jgi:adenylyl-sulfate kinase